MAEWLLLGRPECHLCEEFLDELRAEFPALAVMQANVDDRADWREAYGRRIPVLLSPAGAPVCEGRFEAESLRRAGV